MTVPRVRNGAIQIKVGRKLIEDPNKKDTPVPEFPWGDPFDVEVEWVGPADGLSLTLSDFKLAAFNPCADYLNGEAIWRWDMNYELVLKKRGNEVVFLARDAKEVEKEKGVFVTRESVTIERREIKPRGIPTLQIVLFKQTLKEGETELFVLDPPWVGKPPVG